MKEVLCVWVRSQPALIQVLPATGAPSCRPSRTHTSYWATSAAAVCWEENSNSTNVGHTRPCHDWLLTSAKPRVSVAVLTSRQRACCQSQIQTWNARCDIFPWSADMILVSSH